MPTDRFRVLPPRALSTGLLRAKGGHGPEHFVQAGPSFGPDSVNPETGATTGGGHSTHSRLAFILAKQLRQPRDVGAIHRASSFVRTLACSASASLSRE